MDGKLIFHVLISSHIYKRITVCYSLSPEKSPEPILVKRDLKCSLKAYKHFRWCRITQNLETNILLLFQNLV